MCRTRFIRKMFLLLPVIFALAPAHAQQNGEVGGNGQRYVQDPFAQSLYWLRMPQVGNELKLVPKQKEKIAKLREESTRKMREVYKELRDVKQAERFKKYNQLRRTLNEETERKVQEVLVDPQRVRLRQIVLQLQIRSQGFGVPLLTSDAIAKELGITEQQKKSLRAAQREAQLEFQRKILAFQNRVRREMAEKVLSELTAEQQRTLKKMMGAPYDPQPPQSPQNK